MSTNSDYFRYDSPNSRARAAKTAAREKFKVQLDESNDDDECGIYDQQVDLDDKFDFTFNREVRQTSPFLKLPLELLVKIGLFLPTVQDAIFLSSTCIDLQNALGRQNKHFWYQKGHNAPQAAFQKFNSHYDYRKTLLKIVSGDLSKPVCQVCFETKNVKYFPNMRVKCCTGCFSKNVICEFALKTIQNKQLSLIKHETDMGHILHIPNIDLTKVRAERVSKHWMHPEVITAANHVSVYQWQKWHRKVVFLPHVQRRIEWANPGKTLQQCCDETLVDRIRHEQSVLRSFDNTRGILTNKTWRRTAKARPTYEDLALEPYMDKNQWKNRLRADIKAKAKKYCEHMLAEQYAEAMDQFELPEDVTSEWINRASRSIARDMFLSGGLKFR